VLHVVTTNAGAIGVYDQLGFTLRREHEVIGLRPPEEPARSGRQHRARGR
jgi:hypothetical protein